MASELTKLMIEQERVWHQASPPPPSTYPPCLDAGCPWQGDCLGGYCAAHCSYPDCRRMAGKCPLPQVEIGTDAYPT